MATATPQVNLSLAPDGTFSGTLTVNTATLPKAINWAALLQLLVTYGPGLIAALISIFSPPAPAPAPPPVPAS